METIQMQPARRGGAANVFTLVLVASVVVATAYIVAQANPIWFMDDKSKALHEKREAMIRSLEQDKARLTEFEKALQEVDKSSNKDVLSGVLDTINRKLVCFHVTTHGQDLPESLTGKAVKPLVQPLGNAQSLSH